MLYLNIFLIFLQITNVFTANILHLSVVTSKSHYIWNKVLAEAIADKGHNVTMVSPDKNIEPDTNNFHSIHLEGVYESLYSNLTVGEDFGEMSQFDILEAFNQFSEIQCNLYYNTNGLQQILNYPNNFQFDLILYDISTGPCLFLLIEKFNFPPTIALTPFLLSNYVAHQFGNHLYSSYVPWYGLPYTNQMTFSERLKNLFWGHVDLYYKNYVEFKKEEKLAKEKFGINKKPWSEISRDLTLLFANIDPFLYYPQPLPPNIIPVGGLHAVATKNLPKDLEKFVNESSNGIIVMSLGSNLRSDQLGGETIKSIFKAFGRMPENVLWKFESDIKDVPSNVYLMKWLPQNSVLAYPNVKLFIGHGGTLSTQESIYHGIPMLAIPFMVDQFINAKMLKGREIGDELDVQLITEEYFYNKIRNIIDNPKFKKNAQFISDGFRAQPQSPLERAVFWVEYVLKFGNPTFLNTPLRDMPWYQALDLDILLFIILLNTLIITIMWEFFEFLFRKPITKVKTN